MKHLKKEKQKLNWITRRSKEGKLKGSISLKLEDLAQAKIIQIKLMVQY